MYSGQLSRGEVYQELRRTAVVLILGFREVQGRRFHSCFRMREVHDGEEFSDHLELHILELPKLANVAESEEPKLVAWGKFLMATTDAELEDLAMKDPDFRQAKAALDRLSADPEARLLAEMRDRALKSFQLDLTKARNEGRAEGKAEGRAEGKAEGLKEGQRAVLTTLLTTKFGSFPPAVADRLARASDAQLSQWAARVLEADSLDAVFSDS